MESRTGLGPEAARAALGVEESGAEEERSLVWSEIHRPTCARTRRCAFSRSVSEAGLALTKWMSSFFRTALLGFFRDAITPSGGSCLITGWGRSKM